MTTVLADCPICQEQRECKIVDCDDCFDRYRDAGGDPAIYESSVECEHLECLTCDTEF